ncbi:MAG: YbaK/EbsC family protein [Chloroflexota bacterium]
MLDTSDLARFLEAHRLEAEIVRLPVDTPTVEAAARAVGAVPGRIVKSLLFLVDGQPVVVIACGNQRIEARAVATHFGLGRKRVRLAGPQAVLDATGYPVGALPPFGHRQPLPTLIDRRVLEHDVVYAGGGSIDALLRVASADIVRLTRATPLDLTSAQTPHAAPV